MKTRREPAADRTNAASTSIRLIPGEDAAFESTITQALRNHPSGIVCVDLSALSRLDTSGLRLLVGAATRAAASSTRLVFTGATPPVYKALHLAGVLRLSRNAR